MATKPQPCEWCEKRRLCEVIEVLMRDISVRPALFVRRWMLCSECRQTCEGTLKTAFGWRPE